ncbi:XAC0095 family protein [Noviluteimonas gilva]|uniref:XAC0095-like domain-containing protein n=1 Tax=Noviluteimonas gilva TaxID=2682097 RepID=A0A7C9HPE8_9GAMM|nr:hypothetical protein [Lysobacter gilvus]MUV12591.1 hypothetical protein [Lysobacter gilvus]
MSHANGAPQREPAIYAIPEAAHRELIDVRNQLQLMAQLTTAAACNSAQVARLRPDALAWCFSRLQFDLDAIIARVRSPAKAKKIPRAHA